jgi:hypothetical protein
VLNDGRPVAAVSKRAGHKSAPVALGIYTHAMPGADEIMMEHFDEEYLVRDYNVTTRSKKPQFPAVKLASPTGVEEGPGITVNSSTSPSPFRPWGAGS